MIRDLERLEVTPIPKPTRAVKDKQPLRAKPKSARSQSEAEQSRAWHAAVLAKRNSVIWTAEDYPVIAAGGKPPVVAHHVVSQQCLRKHGIAPFADARNGVPLSKRRHERHHSRIEPLRLDELPDEIHGFLTDHPKLLPWFERTYKPVSPPVGGSCSGGGS